MTYAEATVRHCLLGAIADSALKVGTQEFPQLLITNIINRLFKDPTTNWATKDYWEEPKLNSKQNGTNT